jgi:hypothetical protein
MKGKFIFKNGILDDRHSGSIRELIHQVNYLKERVWALENEAEAANGGWLREPDDSNDLEVV